MLFREFDHYLPDVPQGLYLLQYFVPYGVGKLVVLGQIDKHCDNSVLHLNVLDQVCAHHVKPGQGVYNFPEALTDYLYRGRHLSLISP